MHSILSGAGEVSEEILDGSKNISKYCLLLPNLPSGEPGNYVIVMDPIVAKGAPPLGHVATFFYGVSFNIWKLQTPFFT